MPPIALERIQTDDNTDDLTRTTVQKMCAQIRQSVCGHADLSSGLGMWTCRACAKQWPLIDPRSGQAVTREMIAAENIPVHRAAAYAKKHFAGGSNDPAALSWGVFWYVKHCVKFRSDEGTMMQVGEQALDLLTAPAVLVRMKNPSEDCDGFTELSAALLTILGVPVLVTTVAVDVDDPRRWSHVFLCAVINGRVMPLDTSHGKAPGWMVPRSRINRWQTWKLDGSPADVQIPTYHGLHGYLGMGQAFNPGPNTGIPAWIAARNRKRFIPPPTVRPPMRGVRGVGAWVCPDPENADSCYDDGTTSSSGGTVTFPGQTPSCTYPQVWNGYMCADPTTGLGPTTAIPLNTPLTPAQAGLTAAQQAQLIAAIGNSAVSLIRTAAGGPYMIAGTNNVYNPATGQITLASNPYGVNLSSLPASITNNLPLILGAVAAVFILPSLFGSRR